MKAKAVILSIVGALILVGGIVAGVLLVKKSQDIREKAAPTTTLRLVASDIVITPGESFYMDVLMYTGENNVTGVDIKLTFDPGAFLVTSVQRGGGISSFTNETANTFDNTLGTVTYSANTPETTGAVMGDDIAVLRVEMTAKETAPLQQYILDFGDDTTVTAIGETGSVLIDAVCSAVYVVISDSTPTPTESSTPTATATGVATGTATPTATPTRTPTATPTATSQGTTAPTTTPTATAIATTQVTSTPTAVPIPVSGMSSATLGAVMLGIVSIIFALVLSF